MFTFVDKSQMPSAITESDFYEWYRKFQSLISIIGLPTVVLKNVYIMFSDEEKISTYGSKSIDEIKKQIRETWEINEKVETLLNRIDDSEDWFDRQLQSPLAEEIFCCNPESTYEEVIKELEEIFADLEYHKRILGEYINSSKEIVFYAKNIEHTSDESRKLSQTFEVVFAHEMFHAYHYQNDEEEMVQRRDYTSKVVKESLASSFEWNYCVEYKIPGEYALQASWYKHSIYSYPYSGARKLLEWDNLKIKYCLNKGAFRDVYLSSLSDMDMALRVLVDSSDFYKIKNLIYVRKEKSIKIFSKGYTRAELDDLHAGDNVGKIAREEIPLIIKEKPYLINDLLDRNYCKDTFDFDSYSILSPVRIYKSGKYRYYSGKTNISGTDYYICNNWYEKHREALLNWIWKYKV